MQDIPNNNGEINPDQENVSTQESGENNPQFQQPAPANTAYQAPQNFAQPQGYYQYPQYQPQPAYYQQPVYSPIPGQYYPQQQIIPQYNPYIPVQPVTNYQAIQQPVQQQQPLPEQPVQQENAPRPEQESYAQENLNSQNQIPKFDEHKYGQLIEILNDIATGNTPEPAKVMELVNGVDTQFWKGSVVGALSVFALSNDAVKKSAVNMVAKLMNSFGQAG